MQLRALQDEKDYLQALARFEEIFHAKAGSKESNEADILCQLIKAYEAKYYVIEFPGESHSQP